MLLAAEDPFFSLLPTNGRCNRYQVCKSTGSPPFFNRGIPRVHDFLGDKGYFHDT